MPSVPTPTTDRPERLHALDNLRATMMWLGIVLHVAVIYMQGHSPLPWRDEKTTPLADFLLAFIHAFRMPVFFILAGFFVALLIERRGVRAMVRNRLLRLAMPFALFWAPIFAASAMLALAFLHRMARGTWGLDPELMQLAPATPKGPSTMHLWFLWMLLWLSLLTALVLTALRRWAPRVGTHTLQRAGALLARLGSTPWGIALLAWALAGIGVLYPDGLLHPNGAFLPPWMEWAHNGLFYAFGLALYAHRQALLAHYARRWHGYAVVGWVLFMVTGALHDAPPGADVAMAGMRRLGVAYAYNATSWCWSFALIGFFMARMREPRAWLGYLADSSYWVYLVHMPMTIGFGAAMVGLDWSPLAKMALNIGATSLLSLASYHLLVRYTAIGGLLNGQRRYRRSRIQGVVHAQ